MVRNSPASTASKIYEIRFSQKSRESLSEIGEFRSVCDSLSPILRLLRNSPHRFSTVIPLTNLGAVKTKPNVDGLPPLTIYFKIDENSDTVEITRVIVTGELGKQVSNSH